MRPCARAHNEGVSSAAPGNAAADVLSQRLQDSQPSVWSSASPDSWIVLRAHFGATNDQSSRFTKSSSHLLRYIEPRGHRRPTTTTRSPNSSSKLLQRPGYLTESIILALQEPSHIASSDLSRTGTCCPEVETGVILPGIPWFLLLVVCEAPN